MLIRLLGEESEAMTCTAYQPFTDVPDWALPYAAYAYSKGYTNGVGPTTFGTTMSASTEMYTEFLLRALRYSSTAQSDISNAPERAYFVGVLTAGEVSALRASAFLRADVVYLSYYALETNVSGGSKLSDTLIRAWCLLRRGLSRFPRDGHIFAHRLTPFPSPTILWNETAARVVSIFIGGSFYVQ